MSELYIRLGKALKLERQNKGLSLTQVADLLKSSESTLEKVEEGDFSTFSSPVYFNLYAKSYAEALGVDFTRTLDAIRDDLGEVNGLATPATVSKPTAAAPLEEIPQHGRKKKPVWLFILLAVIALGALAAWILLGGKGTQSRQDQAVTPPVVVKPTIDTSVVQTDTTVFTLSLLARGSSWVALMTDGDTALYRTFSEGETLEVSAVRQMILTVGTPSQIDLRLNGHPVKLADRSGRIANLVITPGNVRAFTGVTDSTKVGLNSDSLGTAPTTGGGPGDSSQRSQSGGGR